MFLYVLIYLLVYIKVQQDFFPSIFEIHIVCFRFSQSETVQYFKYFFMTLVP